MKKITLFLKDFKSGGVEKIFLNLATGLANQKCEVEFLLLFKQGALFDQIPKNISIFELKTENPIMVLFRFWRYLKLKKPDVVISANEKFNLLNIFLLKTLGISSKCLITIHSPFSEIWAEHSTLYNLFLKFLIKIFYKRADQIIAISSYTANHYHQTVGVPINKIKTIYNPVNEHDLLKKSEEEIRHKWLNGKKDYVLLAVGRLDLQKNFLYLIKTFSELPIKNKCKLIILGEGPCKDSLKTAIEELKLENHISLEGFEPNPYKFMRACDLLIISSKYEGIPTVAIESLMLGTPVIATEIPGIIELKNIGIDELYLGPNGNESVFAEIILNKLNTPTDRKCSLNLKIFKNDFASKEYLKLC